MLLSARMLTDVAGVNSYRPIRQVNFTQGDQVTLYFQLIDASLDTAEEGYVPAGRRYVPAAGATLQVEVNNIDDAKKVTRAASQPFTGDASIWSLTLMSTDPVKAGTAAIKLTLTEGGKVTRGVLFHALGVSDQG